MALEPLFSSPKGDKPCELPRVDGQFFAGRDSGAAAWDVEFVADTTRGALQVRVTGQAGTTIRWVCSIETTEMQF